MTDLAVESGPAGCEGGGWTVSRLDQEVEPETLKYFFPLHLFRLHVNTVNLITCTVVHHLTFHNAVFDNLTNYKQIIVHTLILP